MSYMPDSVTVEIAFATDPLSTPTWTDVTDDVFRFSVSRGRQHELDTFEAGTATVTLENMQRQYEPEYSSGANYPNVKPMRRMRITATEGATTYDVFEGFIERWPLTYAGAGKDALVTVTAVDASVFLSILKFPAYPPLVLAGSPKAYYRLGDGPTSFADTTGTYAAGTGTDVATAPSGLLPSDSDDGAATFNGTSSYISLPTGVGVTGAGTFAVEAVIQTTNSSTIGIVYAHTDASGATQDLTQAGLTAAGYLWLSIVDTTGTSTQLTGVTAVNDGLPHHAVWVRDATAGEFRLYVDGVLDASAVRSMLSIATPATVEIGTRNGDGTRGLWFNGTIDEFAFYTAVPVVADLAARARAAGTLGPGTQTSGARIGTVLDELGWPAGKRDLDTGARNVHNFILPSQEPRTHIDQVANTEQGLFFVSGAGDMAFIDRTALAAQTSSGTWGDDGAELPYKDITMSYDVDRVRNDVRISIVGAGTQITTDATSITTYGRRTFTADTHHATIADALSDTQKYVTDYKDPQLRVEQIVLNPAFGDHFADVLARDLGDKITVRRRPPGGGTTLEMVVRIGGIGHAVDPDSGWITTWQLEQT